MTISTMDTQQASEVPGVIVILHSCRYSLQEISIKQSIIPIKCNNTGKYWGTMQKSLNVSFVLLRHGNEGKLDFPIVSITKQQI